VLIPERKEYAIIFACLNYQDLAQKLARTLYPEHFKQFLKIPEFSTLAQGTAKIKTGGG
jgi:hypothetical protein